MILAEKKTRHVGLLLFVLDVNSVKQFEKLNLMTNSGHFFVIGAHQLKHSKQRLGLFKAHVA